MFYSKIRRLANIIVGYSLDIQEGEKLLIEVKGQGTDSILQAIISETLACRATPFWNRNHDETISVFLREAKEGQIQAWSGVHKLVMENIDAYVSIRGSDNAYELSSVPRGLMKHYMKHYVEEVHSKLRVPHKKWVVLRWPNYSMAQLASKGTDEFTEFFFNTCTLDYAGLSENMGALVKLMEATDRVRIVNENTDLTFSIRGIPVQKCDGKKNIPDGEVYTAPVMDSMNGVITYNTPSFYQGKLFNDVHFVIECGRIVEASCSTDSDALNAILDTDEGARYFGEFAIGLNPHVTFPMKDTLFDEKIYGSFHITPGASYDEAFNGNKSAIHWDLVQIQTPEYGGGEIWFDDVCIRKDGEFVLDDLVRLNR